MLALINAFLVAIRAFFRSRVDTSLEVLALRQQVAVLKAAATLAKPLGSVLLDHSTADMAALLRCSSHRETGDGDRIASGGLSPVLALAIAAARRPTQGERGDSGSHSPYSG